LDAKGISPVEDFISEQDTKTKAKLLRMIDLLEEFGLQVPNTWVEKINDVWELKERIGTERYRILYFAHSGKKFILVHAFVKKTQKTPKAEILVAENRRNDYITRATK
jgi:phage-related protein